ncbi:MAG: hypothetical protein JJT85_12015 [Chromatiales bacterium]|nr:hypothetical protein [Chromatiales bacterium]
MKSRHRNFGLRSAGLAAITAIITGCAGTPERPALEPVVASPVLPPVAIYPKPDTGELASLCAEYSASSQLKGCMRQPFMATDLARWIGGTGVFEDVQPRNRNLDYQLYVSHLLLYEETTGSLANALLTGVTLTAVPLPCEMTLHAEIDLVWRGTLLRTDRYELPWQRANCATVSQRVQEAQRQALFSDLMARYLEDVIAEASFTAQVVHAALGSSNYVDDLEAPIDVGDWYLTEQYLYHDPLLGVQLRYRHVELLLDWVDVYVYPIRSTSLADTNTLMEAESLAVRAEISHMAELGLIRSVRHGENRPVDLRAGDEQGQGLYFSTTWMDEHGIAYESWSWLFRSGDKWIKLRFTAEEPGGDPGIKDFAHGLLAVIQVPPESAWMAELRRRAGERE